MAYKIMKTLINGYAAGKGTKTKERLSEMCDVFYGVDKLNDEQYIELMEMLAALD